VSDARRWASARVHRRGHHRCNRYDRIVSETERRDHDAELAQAFSRGDADLKAVYDAHGSLVYSICRRALGDDGAGEVTQDVFLSAWRAREQFDPERGSLPAWLVGITKRRIIDHVRRERRHSQRRADAADDRLAAVTEADVERISERITMAHALVVLPDRAREVIELAYVHDLTHQEIADRTGYPLGTVKSDIRRGLQLLRQQIDRTEGVRS
jgi:RNA polymerase sigma-70 factor, ECF subfamily